MPAIPRSAARLTLCAVALTFALSACDRPEPAAAPAAAPPVTASALPSACNPASTCPGSVCATAITSASTTVPADACPRYRSFQSDVDVYAWNAFVAINWPADPATCAANTALPINAPGPRVWETYALDSDVFVASGQPKAWCSDSLRASLGGPRPFRQHHKAPHSLLAGLEGIEEAVGGVLTDQNRRFVRYEVRINQDEHNYLLANGLWNKAGQRSHVINFPQGASDHPSRCGAVPCGPTGAMEVKSAWKVLSDEEKASGKFYTTEGIVYNDDAGTPSPGRNPVTLGLVGLHVLHKTESEPTWFWATFEHVDNTTKSSYNPSCEDCKPNVQTAAQPYKELDDNGRPLNAPVQVVRTTPIAQADSYAPELSKYYQGLLRDAGSVFQHYELVSVQWAFETAMEGAPTPLANTVLETYVQPNSSCMGCHKQYARTAVGTPADFSFLLGQATQ
ncbi:MAG TPA: hypothetical protein VF017_20360 [Thermoanaerobaculia bacterium]|nr:hypothetical protein [Thermoanaerobaculia bacterium]